MSDTETETSEESSAPEAAPAPAPSPGVANSLKALMDREASVRDQESQLKLVPKLQSELDSLRDKARTNPLRFLEEHGVTLDKLEAMKQEVSDPTVSLQRKIEKLEERLQQRESSESESAREAQLEQAQRGVQKWLDGRDDLPFARAANASGLVVQKIMAHYQATGEVLSEEIVTRDINNKLKDLATKWAPFLEEIENSTADVDSANESKTLTNSIAQSRPSERSSADERSAFASALKMLQFKD